MKKYLGLDLGSKTVGVSISLSGVIAQNLKTIRFSSENYEIASDEIISIVNEYQIDTIILGLPKHMNNDLGIRGQISYDFKKKLEEKSNVEVILWDERTSTQAVIKTLVDLKQSRKKQKKLKDELAATLILQNYLNYKENIKNG